MNSELEIRPGRRVHITQHLKSDAAPTIFFIHGLGGSSDQWRDQIPTLSEHYNLILPELLGHGESDKPHPGETNPYSFLEFSQDLNLIFEKFAGDKNYVLGHSYGGALASLLASAHQAKIQKLILIAPVPCEPRTSIPFVYRLPLCLLNLMRPYLEKKFQGMAFDPADNSELLKEEALAGKRNKLYVIKATLEGMKDIPHFDAHQLLIPTLIFAGESDQIVPASMIQEYFKNLPHHTLHTIAHAGHMIMLEKPEVINKTIHEFL